MLTHSAYSSNGAQDKSVAIVGAGVAGLHLGLHLLAYSIPVTLYSDRTPDQMRASRLPNSVAQMGRTLARNRALGIHDWDAPEFATGQIYFHVGGEYPLRFVGRLAEPMLFVDMRLYLPRLLEEFSTRGGQVVVRDLDVNAVTDLAQHAAPVVVATGRNGLAQMFGRVAAESPYAQPQRLLMAGLFRGIRPLAPQGMCFQISPGQGEIFESRFLAREGRLGGLLVEAIPGSELAVMNTLRYEENPAHFLATLLDLLQRHAPLTYERIDPTAFALNRPLDLLQGAVTPIVRRGYAPVGDHRFVLALGDTHVTHDPLLGQGANAAADSAWLLGETIAAAFGNGAHFDEAFYQQTEQYLWADLQPVTVWGNAMLQPPPPHLIELLVAASQNQAIADAFATNFNAPARGWATVSSPAETATFLAQFGWTPAMAAPVPA
jgi:2-polyprenyl-6-methoxyphenol hydroxylase-like FAD-dependent oxidoreductase